MDEIKTTWRRPVGIDELAWVCTHRDIDDGQCEGEASWIKLCDGDRTGGARCEAHRPAPEPKPTNPKDSIGVRKVPASVVPRQVLAEAALGLLEGACKYGRHNYRAIGVRASVYYDATGRHLDAWWEGQDIDPDSGLSHITKAISSLIVLRDAMLQANWTDDRPPKVKDQDWVQHMNEIAARIMDKYPEPKAAFTHENTKGETT